MSPGSTGGGIKTSTLFTLFHTIKGAATNTQPHAFHYKIPQEAFYKAAIVTALSALVVFTGIFGTVGLSTGITPGLSPWSKLLEILIMYIGRLGPLTIVTIWIFKPDTSVSFPEGSISIG